LENNFKQAESGIAKSKVEAVNISKSLGFPIVIRPSYVLGGRALDIIHEEKQLEKYIDEAVKEALKCNKPAVIDIAIDPKALYSFRRDSFKHREK